MATAIAESFPWHAGEQLMHRLTRVPENENPSTPFLYPRAAMLIQRFPLLAIGALDDQDRPWCTVWGGEVPLAQPVEESVIGIRTLVAGAQFDPVVNAIFGPNPDDEFIEEEGPGRLMAGVSIHLEQRNRIKLMGRMLAGSINRMDEDDNEGAVSQIQLVVKIEQSLGNCPKYLNCKRITPHIPSPTLVSTSTHLCQAALDVISQADFFFISSAHSHEDMDTNNRGGPPGLIRVSSNDESGAVLIYPEYSGNNLYQTLGNLQLNPLAGLAIPDFTTGSILYLTGTTEILIGPAANALLPHSTLAVRFTTTAARFVSDGLPFRGIPLERSPYNPRVRYLPSEKPDQNTNANKNDVMAKLIQKTRLTPSINRYRFAISDPIASGPWKPGQYAALSFYEELSMGYSHMRDDDPTSLNDDFIRNFTVSSRPGQGLHGEEFEVMVRNVGHVTAYLARQNERAGLEVPLLGFGGEFKIEQTAGGGTVGFVAAGIGITPLIAQLADLEVQGLRLFWSVGVKDVGLVEDCFERDKGLAAVTRLFLTGDTARLSKGDRLRLDAVRGSGVRVEMRRLQREDLLSLDGEVEEWYLCTAPALRNTIQQWLPGRKVVFENFDY